MADMKDVLAKLANVDMNKVGRATDHIYKEIDFMLKELQEELQNNYKQFSDWEADFTDSLTNQFADRGNLSEKQVNKLRSIYEKHCM
jgi:hypothetical protein